MIIHATTVAVEGRGVMILGAAGAGKSSLALALIALGAVLVADDQTQLARLGDDLLATCPPPLRGLIEARGMGLLHAPCIAEAPVCLCIDMDHTEQERLPPRRRVTFLERPLDLVLASAHCHFPAAVLHYARYGRRH